MQLCLLKKEKKSSPQLDQGAESTLVRNVLSQYSYHSAIPQPWPDDFLVALGVHIGGFINELFAVQRDTIRYILKDIKMSRRVRDRLEEAKEKFRNSEAKLQNRELRPLQMYSA